MRDRSEHHGREAVGERLPGDLLRQVRRLEIHTRSLVTELFAGEYHSVFKGQGIEFAEVREYVPGDDVRTIDWNVTARFGAPFIKRYSEERELTVFLIVDASGSMQFGSGSVRPGSGAPPARSKADLATQLGALLALTAIRNKDKVGLLIFSDDVELLIPPRKTRTHGLRLVREMLAFHPRRQGSALGQACETAYHALRRRSVVFLLSDFRVPLESWSQPFGALARKHDLIALSIADPLEYAWPEIGIVDWEDLEGGERVLFDTSHAPSRAALQRGARDWEARVGERLRRAGVDQIALEVGQDPVPALMRFFKLRERRRARE
ncbi:MAG: DUF58 domain-containing protein [Candidatus Eisenbacteria bacterium]|nr:DUF58 domain-containing protein [Candidatus Eisenbacteria bacterium]